MNGKPWVLLASALALYGCSGARGPARPSPFPGAPTAVDRAGRSVVRTTMTTRALELVGTPYRLGGERPVDGLDCSGLVRFVFLEAGQELPRTVAEQVAVGSHVGADRIQAGDLVFFDTIGQRPVRASDASATSPPSHVGIALDRDSFVHAPGSGGAVRVDRLSAPYWQERLVAVRRIQF